jgi:serine/threonine-protein kinase HipA
LTGRTLDVWCFDERAGVLTDAPDGLTFEYDRGWVARQMPPLSQSLPLSGDFGTQAVRAFFDGLLPEGTPRRTIARLAGVSEGNTFGLLEAIGGDTAGAVSLLPPGSSPEPPGHDVEWLDDQQLETVIDELPARPMHADEDGEFRLSLAGVQDKLPVVVGSDGRIGLTKGRTPSTHILKTPIESLSGTVLNEALCPEIGRRLGIDTVVATPHRVGDREFLLVERYDRAGAVPAVRRLHQEDFCQALGIPSDRKYQSEGGPGLQDSFALLARATGVPASEAIRLLDSVALNFLVGNHDAHGKNFSLLYLPEAVGAVLAPAYDVLSTIAYEKVRKMSRKMAMSIGGEYRADYVRGRHLSRLLDEAGLGPAAARRRLRRLAGDAPVAARDAATTLRERGWTGEIADGVIAVVDRRSRMLEEIVSDAGRGGSRAARSD